MIFRRTQVDLTAAERRLYDALRRDVEVDASHEDRTVVALREAGVLGSPSGVTSVRRQPAKAIRRRVTAMIAASAALIVAVIGTSTLLYVRRGDNRAAQHHQAARAVPRADSATITAPHSSYLVWY